MGQMSEGNQFSRVHGAIAGPFQYIEFTGGHRLEGATADVLNLVRGGVGNVILASDGAYVLWLGYNSAAVYGVGVNKIQFAASNVVSIGGAADRASDGYFGGSVGYHTGTRFTSWIDVDGVHVQTAGGTLLLSMLDTTGCLHHRNASYDQYRARRLANMTGVATVAGYVYSVGGGAISNCVGAPCAVGANFRAAGNLAYVVCVGGGVAHGSADFFVPLSPGEILSIYVDGATVLDQFVDLTAGGGVAGQCTPAAVMTAGRTIAVVLTAIGAPGLCRVYLQPVWA